MMRILLAALLLPVAGSAQLKLFLAPPNSEIAVSGLHDLGSTSVGDRLDTRFRVRNTGTGPVTVTALDVAGLGFSITGAPSLPHILASGNNIDFTVRFVARDFGSYSANLTINGLSLLLRAAGLAAVSVKVDDTSVAAGDTIDFLRTERGLVVRRVMRFENATTQTVTVEKLAISGAAFSVASSAELPIRLAPGEASVHELKFQPAAAGPFTGTLTIDARTFRLTGAATEPPFERPIVQLEAVPAGSASQGKVSVRFERPSRAKGSGVLRLVCTPINGAFPNDPSIVFLATGKRDIPFTVDEGATEARFGAAAEALFQTGTTAGAFRLEASVGGFTEESNFTVNPAAVRIERAAALKNGAMLELSVSAYDNTHATGLISFTFYDRSSRPIQQGAIRVDSSADFRKHFAKEQGGTFSLKAVFPVAGNVADIGEADIELTNGAGAARTEKLRF